MSEDVAPGLLHIPPEDLEVKVRLANGYLAVYEVVTIKHLPTGLVAHGSREGSLLATKTRLMQELRSAIEAGVPADD